MDLPEQLTAELATADADDRGPLLVAADWLAQRGESLGELVALELNLNGAALGRAAIARKLELLREHDPLLGTEAHYTLDRRFGLVDRLAVTSARDLARALAAPSVRWLRSLAVFDVPPQIAIAALAAAAPRTLRELHLFNDATAAVDLDTLLPRLPHLATLHVDGASYHITHATLRELRLRTDGAEPVMDLALDTPALRALRWASPVGLPIFEGMREPPIAMLATSRAALAIPGVTAPDLAVIDDLDGVILERASPLLRGASMKLGPHTLVERRAYTVGRSINCDIVVDDRRAPRRSITLELGVDTAVLRDTTDDPPTRLFGLSMRTAALREGDEIWIGLRCYRVQLVPPPPGAGSSMSSSPVQ